MGKTYVAALIARPLAADGRRVGVYKPAASGCRRDGDRLVSDDAVRSVERGRPAGRAGSRLPAALRRPAGAAPGRPGGRQDDSTPHLLRRGLDYWRAAVGDRPGRRAPAG